ncbi:MAG: DMT family transporter [Rhizobiaceae bacterium]|nr:DMT family transporter [Rhizobiaceae bacterium]
MSATGVLPRRADALNSAAIATMLGLTFAWALNSVAAKIALAGFNPILLSVLRSVVAASAVYLWCRWRGVEIFGRDGSLPGGVLAGSLFGMEFALIFLSLDYTSVSRLTLTMNTMPFWVLIGAHVLLGERMSATKFGGLVLAFCGVALVFADKLSLPGPDALIGDAMGLAAGVLWAATTLVIRRTKVADAPAEKILLYQLVVGAIVVLPLFAVAGPPLRDVSSPAIVALLFQALVIVAFTYVVWFGMIRRYPAASLSSFTFLTPVFGVACGGILLDEPLSPILFAALALVAAGLVLVNRPAK